jgi:hypothetical protein
MRGYTRFYQEIVCLNSPLRQRCFVLDFQAIYKVIDSVLEIDAQKSGFQGLAVYIGVLLSIYLQAIYSLTLSSIYTYRL